MMLLTIPWEHLGSRERAQSVENLLEKHKDLSSDSYHLIKGRVPWHTSVIPLLQRQTRADLYSLLARYPRQIYEVQVQWKVLSQNMRWKVIEGDTKGCSRAPPPHTPNLEVTVYNSNYHSFDCCPTKTWSKTPWALAVFNVCVFRHSGESLSLKFLNILKATELLPNKFSILQTITCRKQCVFKMPSDFHNNKYLMDSPQLVSKVSQRKNV